MTKQTQQPPTKYQRSLRQHPILDRLLKSSSVLATPSCFPLIPRNHPSPSLARIRLPRLALSRERRKYFQWIQIACHLHHTPSFRGKTNTGATTSVHPDASSSSHSPTRLIMKSGTCPMSAYLFRVHSCAEFGVDADAYGMFISGVAPCPAELYIMTRDYQKWDSVPLAIPDVALMHIECRTKATSSRYSEHSRDQDHWRVVFDGSEMPSTKGPTPANIPADSISVEYKWDRIYSMPTVGKGCKGNSASSSSSSTASTPPTIPVTLSPSKLLPTFFYTPPSTAAPGRGWVMRFWIPVPLHLFLKKETRVFEISAKVWLAPNSPKPKGPLSKFSPPSVSTELGDIDADFIEASTEMTVSHLRKEREMGFWL
ncbi:hypothetical protein CC2G_000196 [Coprinopsis cinerea AmutBmut pab1-1]|nr:hypothetical protein CC2G_000196 [Coprinopsis cinerea AmutBmut pab1-1]